MCHPCSSTCCPRLMKDVEIRAVVAPCAFGSARQEAISNKDSKLICVSLVSLLRSSWYRHSLLRFSLPAENPPSLTSLKRKSDPASPYIHLNLNKTYPPRWLPPRPSRTQKQAPTTSTTHPPHPQQQPQDHPPPPSNPSPPASPRAPSMLPLQGS
jgi:hypothetical protein